LKTILLILFNVLLLTSGQILWKKALNEAGGISLNNMFHLIFSPMILAGILLYVVATAVWFIVLSRASLSYAYPLQSLAYVLGVLAAWQIFKDEIPLTRWVGVLVIIIGVVLVSYNKQKVDIKPSETGTQIYRVNANVPPAETPVFSPEGSSEQFNTGETRPADKG